MNLQTNIVEEIYHDDVGFFADRYHTTPDKILQCFIEQNDTSSEAVSGAFRLEENEMSILQDIISETHK